MPATPPRVMTVPIGPVRQPCAERNTPRKGPIPGLHVGHEEVERFEGAPSLCLPTAAHQSRP